MEQPKIPTLKDSQKPQVKIKGLAAGMSLFDRLKTFKKKDLAFILAGLGTLFMAPLAEHFMMAPESGDGTMQQGWGGKGGSNLFGSGSSPYESGITGLAPGGAIGGGGDVITPLNVRDPSALVMGPGMTQQPPAGSIVPQTPPPSASKEPDLKDALANAAARAAGAATRKAPVPVPKPAMTGSGLRGLGVASGGSSAGAGLAPINSAGLSTNRAAASNSLGDVRPSSSYRGVARGPGKGSGGSEALKAAAGGAGDLFNKGGSAAGNAEQAAQVAMPGGNAFGGGNGGAGGADKGPGGNNSNGSKSVGESLEFLRQKQEMEKALDLKWKMKEKRAMFPLELQQEAAKTIVMKGVVEPLASSFGDLVKNAFTPASSQVWVCQEGALTRGVPASQVAENCASCSGKTYCRGFSGGKINIYQCGGQNTQLSAAQGIGCDLQTRGGAAAGATPGANPEQVGVPSSMGPGAAPVANNCNQIGQVQGARDDTANQRALRQWGANNATITMTLSGSAGTGEMCGGRRVGNTSGSGVVDRQANAKAKLNAALTRIYNAQESLRTISEGTKTDLPAKHRAAENALKAPYTQRAAQTAVKDLADLYAAVDDQGQASGGMQGVLNSAKNELDGAPAQGGASATDQNKSVQELLEAARAELAVTQEALTAIKNETPAGAVALNTIVDAYPAGSTPRSIAEATRTQNSSAMAALAGAERMQRDLTRHLATVGGQDSQGGYVALARADLATVTGFIEGGQNATSPSVKQISTAARTVHGTLPGDNAPDNVLAGLRGQLQNPQNAVQSATGALATVTQNRDRATDTRAALGTAGQEAAP